MTTHVPSVAATDRSSDRSLARRRVAVAVTVLAFMAVLIGMMGRILGHGGFTWAEIGMWAAFSLTTPWIALGFCNGVIGFAILTFAKDPAGTVNPSLAGAGEADPIVSRNAIVMAVRNEDTGRVFRHIETIQRSVDATGEAASFDYFIISDTTDPVIAAAEEAAIADWRARDWRAERIHYRRRERNTGFKAGNVRDFCGRWGGAYDHMIMLDADSLMSGRAILRLVRIMQADPRLGILQSLVVGLPSGSAFARIFQFGMRQGMRSYTVGSAWWQGEYGPYWGHNAIIRLAPFIAHCDLPVLPGDGPLGGHILSHDQVEAVLMRRAGYDVRVLADEAGSWEENPPALPDFLKRDLRWCQGNMQYWRLLGMPGLAMLSRVQLVLAILMYVGAPAWMAFIGFGAANVFVPAEPTEDPFPRGLAYALFGLTMFMTLAPKIFGVFDILLRREERARYGGALRVAGGAGIELVFSVLLSPIVSLTEAIFMAGLAFGRDKIWAAQNRDSHYVPLARAARGFWPHLVAAIGFGSILWLAAPGALPWAAPLLLGFGLAIPFTSLTSSPALGRLAARLKLCAIPEEIEPVAEVDRALARPVSLAPRGLAQAA